MQEQRAEMLFDGATADVELAGNLFVATALYEQIRYLLVAWSDFHLNEVDHWFPPACSCARLEVLQEFRHWFVA